MVTFKTYAVFFLLGMPVVIVLAILRSYWDFPLWIYFVACGIVGGLGMKVAMVVAK